MDKYLKLTIDAIYDEAMGGWKAEGHLDAEGKPMELACLLGESIKSHDEKLATMAALYILSGSPLPGAVKTENTVIDLGAIEKARGTE